MRVNLISRLIETVDYDFGTKALRLEFTNGQRREYEDVPLGIVNGLVLSKSPGDFYFTCVRGKYPLH